MNYVCRPRTFRLEDVVSMLSQKDIFNTTYIFVVDFYYYLYQSTSLNYKFNIMLNYISKINSCEWMLSSFVEWKDAPASSCTKWQDWRSKFFAQSRSSMSCINGEGSRYCYTAMVMTTPTQVTWVFLNSWCTLE
jgi:hypothetical protein